MHLVHDNPAVQHTPIDPAEWEEMRGRLRRLLDARQLRVLSSWLEGKTIAEVARDETRPRTTVRLWIRAARQRLDDAGIKLPAPVVVKAVGADMVYCDPAALDRLVSTPEPSRSVSRWINSAKTDQRREN